MQCVKMLYEPWPDKEEEEDNKELFLPCLMSMLGQPLYKLITDQ